jgi:hypothetical protein
MEEVGDLRGMMDVGDDEVHQRGFPVADVNPCRAIAKVKEIKVWLPAIGSGDKGDELRHRVLLAVGPPVGFNVGFVGGDEEGVGGGG